MMGRAPTPVPPAFLVAVVLLGCTDLAPTLPLGVPFDERSKVDFGLKGQQNFRHPIFMLPVLRVRTSIVAEAAEA